jgi:gas vesicle protein
MSHHDKNCAAGSVLFSFFLGGIFGAALTLLMSPMSGPEARRRIHELGDDLKDKAEDMVHEAKDKASAAVEVGKELLEGKKGIISSAIEAGRDAYEKEKEKFTTGD